MKKTVLMLIISVIAISFFAAACSKTEQAKEPQKDTNVRGEALFKQNCNPCHPDGGNVMNPQKTLHKKDLEANGVITAKDIVDKMRKPGPGMTPFDQQNIPDSDARLIAEYVLTTFN